MIRRLAAGLVLLALLTSCSGTDDEPGPAPSTSADASETASTTAVEPAKPAPRPADRACYQLDYEQAVAPTSDVQGASCADAHTALTYHVGTLDTVLGGHLLAVDAARVQAQPARACPRLLARFLGGTTEQRHLSVLRGVWFTPTVEQSDDGADWFRCDVIALHAAGELAPLTGRMAGVLDTEAGRNRYGLCGTAEPGTRGFSRVICSSPHSWRAIATVDFPAGRYPGEARVRAAGSTRCEDAARDVASDALNFKWGYEWPTAKQWTAGQTYGLCWTPV